MSLGNSFLRNENRWKNQKSYFHDEKGSNNATSRETRAKGVPIHFISRRGGAIVPRSGTSFQPRQCEGAGTGTSQNRAPPPQPSQLGAGGTWRVLALASCRRKACVSEDHLPPTSHASTTNLVLPWAPENSRQGTFARSDCITGRPVPFQGRTMSYP